MGKADTDTISTTVSGSPNKCDHSIVGRHTGLCIHCGYQVFSSARLAEVDPKITPSAPAAETAETASARAQQGCPHEFGTGFCVRCGLKKPDNPEKVVTTAPIESYSNLQIRYAKYCKKCKTTCQTYYCGECGSHTESTPTFDSATVSVRDMMHFLCLFGLRILIRIVMLACGHTAIIMLMIGVDLVPMLLLTPSDTNPSRIVSRDYREVSAAAIGTCTCFLAVVFVAAILIAATDEHLLAHHDYLSLCPSAWRLFCTMMFIIEICLHAFLAGYFRDWKIKH